MGCSPLKNSSYPLQLQLQTKRVLQATTTHPMAQSSPRNRNRLRKKSTMETAHSGKLLSSQELGLESYITVAGRNGQRRLTRKQVLREMKISQEFFREVPVEQGVFAKLQPSMQG